MSAVYLTFALLAVVGFGTWLHGRRSRETGRLQARSDAQEETIDHAETANDAKDRLRRDGGYARRLRDRFTRK